MSDTPFVRYVASHPRLTGVLFAVALLLVQFGPVLAGDGGGACATCGGP